jgi:hypothetical protein
MRKVVVGFVVIGVLLSLAACANGPAMPTTTPISLAVTVTPRPRPTRLPTRTPAPLPTRTPAEPSPSPAMPTPVAATPTAAAADLVSRLDDQLARRTVRDFLDRLAAGRLTDALHLYLTDEALAGEPGRLLSQLASSGTRLTSITFLKFLWATDTTYEAGAELRWAESDIGGPATQSLELVIAYQRGLWLIDDVTLGKLQAIAPTSTPRAATSTKRRQPQPKGRLVFQVSSGGDIYTINADGSGLRRLTDGLDPAWSPDHGQRIAFTRWRHPWGLYLIRPDGTGEERVADGILLKEVAWSPDGSRLAVTINYSSNEPITICFFGFCFTLPPFSFGQIWTIDLETHAFLNLPLDDEAVHAPAWSPTEERIVYAGDRGLSWIDLDDMDKGIFAGGSAWDTSPTFSPDGTKIAFMGRAHDRWEIFIMNADGSGRKRLTHSEPRLKDPPSNVAPAWSPNGNYLAFLSNRDGPWRIYVMKADGTQQRPMFGDALDKLGFRYEWATERVISWSE